MIGNPCLAALVLAPDPVAEELALVGVALLLDAFVVHELAVVGWYAFDADGSVEAASTRRSSLGMPGTWER